jgi:multiple sugar transport system permease protein
MTSATTAPSPPAERQRDNPGRRGFRRRRGAGPSSLLTLAMLAFLVYFLIPLFWLLVASTKSSRDLFTTFGLWPGHAIDIVENVRRTFTYNGGVYGRWMLNTLVYSVVSAGGAAFLAALGGFGFAKYRFRGNTALFGVVLASVMVPTTALRSPPTCCSARSGSSTRRGPSSCRRWSARSACI